MFTTERLHTYVKHIMCLSSLSLVALNTNSDRLFFIFSWLPMYKFYVFCHGRFLNRPLITQVTLRPLALMYLENMSLKISSGFPLEWTLVATGQELNHVMHKTRVRPQTTFLCKSSLAKITVKSYSWMYSINGIFQILFWWSFVTTFVTFMLNSFMYL